MGEDNAFGITRTTGSVLEKCNVFRLNRRSRTIGSRAFEITARDHMLQGRYLRL